MHFVSTLMTAATVGLALAAPVSQKKKRVSKFQFFGVNESGAEFGNTIFPGQKNKDYVWPNLPTIDTFISRGMNAFRIAFQMERLIPSSMSGSFNQTYFQDLQATVNYITGKGAYAIIEPHNFGRYYGNVISDVTGFGNYWRTVATAFKDNSRVIFDTNNEYHDMDQNLVVNLNQAAINAIRGAGATSQYITVEGNSWTGAWTWTTSGNGATMGALTDPQNKILYQMHQYLDSDGSGTHAECVSGTIGQERIAAATQWLKQNGKQAILGEFAGGNNNQCKTAIRGMLSYMNQNTDVWKGAFWWAAGPWWGTYMYSIEPTSGVAYGAYLDLILQYQ